MSEAERIRITYKLLGKIKLFNLGKTNKAFDKDKFARMDD